jgi:hypothetical protein
MRAPACGYLLEMTINIRGLCNPLAQVITFLSDCFTPLIGRLLQMVASVGG